MPTGSAVPSPFTSTVATTWHRSTPLQGPAVAAVAAGATATVAASATPMDRERAVVRNMQDLSWGLCGSVGHRARPAAAHARGCFTARMDAPAGGGAAPWRGDTN